MKWGFRFELEDDHPRGRAGWLTLVFAALLAGLVLGIIAAIAAHTRL